MRTTPHSEEMIFDFPKIKSRRSNAKRAMSTSIFPRDCKEGVLMLLLKTSILLKEPYDPEKQNASIRPANKMNTKRNDRTD